ncbi:hypothetical protein LF1_24010 [Rubripirellula obstinata]|uniref:EF-hand domain-containing protein n=2 Tax=Rubripirellula obstinata TaxID=406547 RepID=A0A5B1CKL1_9BACT|nr:hypothetical protein LF1_24010 [Rubripirellula obstinata]
MYPNSLVPIRLSILSVCAVRVSVFGSSSSDPHALAGLDLDGDGGIGLTDFAAFRSNLERDGNQS